MVIPPTAVKEKSKTNKRFVVNFSFRSSNSIFSSDDEIDEKEADSDQFLKANLDCNPYRSYSLFI